MVAPKMTMTASRYHAHGRMSGHRAHGSQRGFSLVEVMIAVLVLAVGLLGVGATLTATLRNNQSAMHRTQASIQAHAAMDMMRADKSNAVIGRYNLTSWTCNAPSSDNQQGAALASWIGALKSELGTDACGRITCNNVSCSVDVRWDDSRGLGGRQQQTIGISSRL